MTKRSIFDANVGDLLLHDYKDVTQYNYIFYNPLILIVEPLVWIRISLKGTTINKKTKYEDQKGNERYQKSLQEDLYLLAENVEYEFFAVRKIILDRLKG